MEDTSDLKQSMHCGKAPDDGWTVAHDLNQPIEIGKPSDRVGTVASKLAADLRQLSMLPALYSGGLSGLSGM